MHQTDTYYRSTSPLLIINMPTVSAYEAILSAYFCAVLYGCDD